MTHRPSATASMLAACREHAYYDLALIHGLTVLPTRHGAQVADHWRAETDVHLVRSILRDHPVPFVVTGSGDTYCITCAARMDETGPLGLPDADADLCCCICGAVNVTGDDEGDSYVIDSSADRRRSGTVRCPHDCGVCDGSLRFEGFTYAGNMQWSCDECGHWHTSRDCCEEGRRREDFMVCRDCGRVCEHTADETGLCPTCADEEQEQVRRYN